MPELKIKKYYERAGIEACRFDASDIQATLEMTWWCTRSGVYSQMEQVSEGVYSLTVDHVLVVKDGDYLVKEHNGFATYSPEIFNAIYEKL